MTSPGETLAVYAPLVPRMLAMATTVLARGERNLCADDLAAVATAVNAAATWAQAMRRRITEPAETHPGLILRQQMLENSGRRRRTG